MSLPSIKRRLASGISLAVALFAVFFLLPDVFLPLVLAAIAALLGLEFAGLLWAGRAEAGRTATALGCAAMTLGMWFWGAKGLAAAGIVATAGMLVGEFPKPDREKTLARLGGTFFGVFYIGLLWSFLAGLLVSGVAGTWQWINGVPWAVPASGYVHQGWGTVTMAGRWVMLYAIFLAKFSDIGAYLVGCTWGRHKLIPRLSPGKSWEGLVGGVAAGTLSGVILVACLPDVFGPVGLTWTRALWVGPILSLAGATGDLAESLVKRAAGVKDSGSTIPGMGGVLDLLDSLMFTAPALYVILMLLPAA